MTRRGLAARLGLSWATALLLLAFAEPPSLASPWPPAPAAAVGVAAGAGLYAALARRRPRVPALGLVLVLVLVLWAGAEEVLWRWFALAEAASRIGFALGLALTSAAFAAVHRNRSFGHAVAGGVFGLVFAATGTIVAAWAAHAAYNLLVAGSARGRLPPLSFSDTGAARAPE